jgi:hypothetical protein
MNKLLLQAIGICCMSILFLSCHKAEEINTPIPACLNYSLIDLQKSGCNTGASLTEYTFQGKTVYCFNPGNCGADMAASVRDSNCTILGYLGGYDGNTKINGVDFATAVLVKVIWHN